MSKRSHQELLKEVQLSDEALLSSPHKSWGAPPPSAREARPFIGVERASNGAGLAMGGALLWAAFACPGQGWHWLWQAPAALILIKAARLCCRLTLLGWMAGGAREGVKSGALVAQSVARLIIALPFFILGALLMLAIYKVLSESRQGVIMRRFGRVFEFLGVPRAVDWLTEGAELAMARRLGPIYAWSVAFRRADDSASEWFFWSLWRAAPFDPSWPLSSAWVGAPKRSHWRQAFSCLTGPSWIGAGGRNEAWESLLGLAGRSRSLAGPSPRSAQAPDPEALRVALEREELARSIEGLGEAGESVGFRGAL